MAPISTSPLLIYAPGAVSCLPIALGINALIRPSSPLELLGWPIPTDPYGKKLALNLMRVYGGRNIALGLSMAIPAYFGHRKALGWMVLGSSVVAIVDGFQAERQGKETGTESGTKRRRRIDRGSDLA
ncbi:hypothetical protein EHS25_009976 [Saitozyma podzolica]|uniref:Uncharacterized protein n=1 Tax=Saitozyma podzolica TaxID=1890683 RepID=A0A427YI97_9TREE|nr:hypothetical protein EHS25_009976 [Saitozyma podzolica]